VKVDNMKRLFVGFLMLLVAAVLTPAVLAQGVGSPPGIQTAPAGQSGTNLDLQLQILVASNSGETTKAPPALEGIVRDLRNNLQVSNIHLTATFQHRVENNGKLEVNGVGTSQLASPTSNPQYTPTFYNYSINPIKLVDGPDGRTQAQLGNLRFQLRVPVQVSAMPSGGNGQPNVVYETMGIGTGITIPLGEPVVVGTLNVGRQDETLIVIITARRAAVH
jgi:hypothetical protein